MLSAFLVLFRETLEAALVVGIMLALLYRTGRRRQARGVLGGAAAGVGASIVGAVLFHFLAGGFEGPSEQIFEGITMLAASILMVGTIAWFAAQGGGGRGLEARAEQLSAGGGYGLFLLAAVSVLREGVEAVLFVAAAGFQARTGIVAGAFIGFAAALVLGALFLVVSRRIRLGPVFTVSNALLVLFASGLASGSVHEFAEAGILTAGTAPVWNLNPPLNADGSFPLLHDDGAVGSILKGLFGWRGSPSLAEILAYIAFGACAVALWILAARRSARRMRRS